MTVQTLPVSLARASSGNAIAARSRQAWVLGPLQDSLLILAAPLISLALAIAALRIWGPTNGATLVLLTHVVFTVAHHLPTFIRAYGDVQLTARFRWQFILVPLVVFSLAMTLAMSLAARGVPLDRFLFLYIVLTLWDPWHFMRQHYGFMRLYDRGNAAPKRLSARMDLALAAVWFAYMLIASGDWLLDLLEDMNARLNWSWTLAVTGAQIAALSAALRTLALLMSGVYVGFLLWCRRRGFAVSTAKVLLCVCTFAVMFVTYTPNALIASLAPGWSFRVGFAVIGIVHMTQYLAIVWRHNQRLSQQPGHARPGAFQWLHSRRTWLGVALYVALCLLYGDVVTTVHGNQWLMATLLAIGFTSTMMHYYFDGFIWKSAVPPDRGTPRVGLRHTLYLAAPLLLLTVCAAVLWGSAAPAFAAGGYVTHMYEAQALSMQGRSDEAAQEARRAYADMHAQLPLTRRRAALQPSAPHFAELAFLIYNESLYENAVMPALDGRAVGSRQREAHLERVREAVEVLSHAIAVGGPLAHAGRAQLSRAQAQAVLASWRHQVGSAPLATSQ